VADEMKIKALAPWFGSNRVGAAAVGKEIGRVSWCGVPFCGGCPELPEIDCRAGVANDLHRHIINLARVVRHPVTRSLLSAALEHRLFHPDELAAAQKRCYERQAEASALFGEAVAKTDDAPDVEWAADYFTCAWMGRGGNAGRDGEFDQSLALRFTASGGSSAKRFQSAVDSLVAWQDALKSWEFSTVDAIGFIDRVRDEPGYAVYIDAPWPDAGLDYKHPFSDKLQAVLARAAARFKAARVVIRFGDHPLIRELYPEDRWTWVRRTTRDQQNGEVAEVLIINGRSYTEAA